MKKVLLFVFASLMFSIEMSAQASGGQITRKRTTTSTVSTPSKNRQVGSMVNENKTSKRDVGSDKNQNSSIGLIKPVPIKNLFKYNVVCDTYADHKNASNLCSQLRGRGYNAIVYKDSHKFYRVIIYRTYDIDEAHRYKNSIRSLFPQTCILIIDKGKEFFD